MIDLQLLNILFEHINILKKYDKIKDNFFVFYSVILNAF